MWITLESLCDDKDVNPLVSELNTHGELIENLSSPWRNRFFAVFISEHQKLGAKSKHAAYIASLPSDMGNYPTLFDEKTRDMLKGTQMIN